MNKMHLKVVLNTEKNLLELLYTYVLQLHLETEFFASLQLRTFRLSYFLKGFFTPSDTLLGSYGAEVKKYPSLIFFCEKTNIDAIAENCAHLLRIICAKFHIKNLQKKFDLFGKGIKQSCSLYISHQKCF